MYSPLPCLIILDIKLAFYDLLPAKSRVLWQVAVVQKNFEFGKPSPTSLLLTYQESSSHKNFA